MAYNLGIDVGSTTVKVTVLDEALGIVYTSYERHFARVREGVLSQLAIVEEKFGAGEYRVSVTGSAGLGIAQRGGLPFVQEVQSAFGAIRKYYPATDVAVELGGEDAKIIFVTGGTEQRMNGSCAGGTGAFIDQMATLLNLTVSEMDELSLQAKRVYPIASRCGVFAKSDIQPLLNQGASKADISASIFQAVVDQTVSGLAQGRRIKGNVLFLGGPLYFLKGLRLAFCRTLGLDEQHAIFPETAPCFMSIGAALYAAEEKPEPLSKIRARLLSITEGENIAVGEPLFASQGRRLVAEGIETKRHADVMSKLGCDALQGYYYARPMTAAELKDYVSSATSARVVHEKAFDEVLRQGEIEGLCVDPSTGDLLLLYNRGAHIVLGMTKGLYPGYDKEIHEIYRYAMIPAGKKGRPLPPPPPAAPRPER